MALDNQPEGDTKCYLCGKATASTLDHVVPFCLFDSPAPSNLITAPACFRCNNSLSKDEEFFRVFVLTGQDRLLSAKKLWKEKVLSSFQRSPRFKEMLKERVRLSPVSTEGGLYLGEAPLFYAERGRIDRVLRKIAKGLFYRQKGICLEGTVHTVAHYIFNPESWKKIDDLPGVELGEGIFKCRFAINKDNPHNSTWLFVFYEKHFFIVQTKAQDRSVALKGP